MRGKTSAKKRRGMTRAQRDVQNKQNRKKREEQSALAAREDHKNELIPITLRVGHSVNGIKYGPGNVTLPRELANNLLEDDKRAVAHEEDLFQSYGVIIGPPKTKSGIATTRKVPIEVLTGQMVIEPIDKF